MERIGERQTSSGVSRLMSSVLTAFEHWMAMALRRGRRGRLRRMALVESLELGNRRQLFLVTCDDRHFLVGAGADRIGTVIAMPEPEGSSSDPLQSFGSQARPDRMRPGSSRPREAHAGWFDAAGTSGLRLVKRATDPGSSARRQRTTDGGKSQC